MAEFHIIISDLPTSESQEFIDLVSIHIKAFDTTDEISASEHLTQLLIEALKELHKSSANWGTDPGEQVH